MFKKYQLMLLLYLLFWGVSTRAADVEKLGDSTWIKLATANFELITDVDEETARFVLKDLENFRHFTIHMMGLNVLEGLPPLKILAVERKKNFKYLDLPDNWAGVFQISINGYSAIANVDNYRNNLKAANFARHTLLHEYVHYLVRMSYTSLNYPKWFDEGYAEYMATFSFDGKNIYLGNAKSLQFRAGDMLNMGGSLVFASEKLFNTTFLDVQSEKRKDQNWLFRFYAQSFFLVHFFNSSSERKAMLNTYLVELNAGFPKGLAFQRAFGMTYEELDKEVKNYLKNDMKMRVFSASSGGITFPEVTPVVKVLNKAEFYAELPYTLLNFGVFDDATRKKILALALEHNPDNIELKNLALTYPGIEKREQLLAEVEKASPNHAVLLTVKGDELYAQAEQLRLAGDPDWQNTMKQARSFYRRAIKADRQYSKPYWGLGKVYDFLPATEPLQEGVVGYETASMYEQDEQVFANNADLLIRMDKPMDALPVVRTAIAFATNEPDPGYVLILNNLALMQVLLATEPPVKSENGLSYANGCRYEGSISNNKPEGNGKLTHPDGSYYQGQFSNGLMQGTGKLVSSQGISYQGEFKQGVMKGKGRIDYLPQDGFTNHYDGEVYYGVPQGKGSFTTKYGVYTGDYWYSWRHGDGEYISADGKVKLKGRWNYHFYVWPEEAGEVFIGGFNAAGQRHYTGLCRKQTTPAIIERCEYKDGKRVVDVASAH